MFGGVLLVQRQTHRNTHPEVLGNLKGVSITTLDGVAVVQGDHTDVLEKIIVAGVDFLSERVHVKHLGQTWVKQPFVNTARDVGSEVVTVKFFELFGSREVSENTLVDGFEKKACGNNVECGVIFDVLECYLNDSFVELLGGNSIKKSDFKFGGNLGNPGNVVMEACRCLFDRQVDLVGVILFALSVALYDGDSHVFFSFSRDFFLWCLTTIYGVGFCCESLHVVGVSCTVVDNFARFMHIFTGTISCLRSAFRVLR